MDVIGLFVRLRARKFLVVLALLIAVAVALSTRFSFTHGFRSKATSTGAADAQILVDTKQSTLGSIQAATTDAEIDQRAPLYAEYAASSSVIPVIASQAGVPITELAVTANTSEASQTGGATVSTSYNTAPVTIATRYQVTLTANNDLPIIEISTTAPSAAGAVALANATLAGLRLAVSDLTKSEKIPRLSALTLRSLGPPAGGTIVSSPKTSKAALYGVAAFVVLCLLILLVDSAIPERRRTALGGTGPATPIGDSGTAPTFSGLSQVISIPPPPDLSEDVPEDMGVCDAAKNDDERAEGAEVRGPVDSAHGVDGTASGDDEANPDADETDE